MDVLLIVDMQEAGLCGEPLHGISEVALRINRIASSIRDCGGTVVFVQHSDASGTPFEPGTPGWKISQMMDVRSNDLRIQKCLNDAFAETDLMGTLSDLDATRVIVTGQATDFCIDSTVRSAVSRRIPLVVASDCHTLRHRPHLTAEQVIQHHNWVWANLYAPASIELLPASRILETAAAG
jgi:nicotinamidase-related amidase